MSVSPFKNKHKEDFSKAEFTCLLNGSVMACESSVNSVTLKNIQNEERTKQLR